MTPQTLQKGDTVLIIAPAKAIEKEYVDFAEKTLIENGFNVIVSQHCLGRNNYFSGTEEERKTDLQWAINHPEAKAILCARGGYGCVQIVEEVDWSEFYKNPKWLIGFSDVTVFHQFLSLKGHSSIHATMPLNFKENSPEAIGSLLYALKNVESEYHWESSVENLPGTAKGQIVGGNLTVLVGLIGTTLMPDYTNKILFIEDVGEALYAIDRCFYQLDKSGVLDKISGLIVGNFSSMRDSEPPYGKTLEEIIKSHFKTRNIPVIFDFPAGHCDDNRAIMFGEDAVLIVEEQEGYLKIGNRIV